MKRFFALTAIVLLVIVSCSDERSIEPLENQGMSSLTFDPQYVAEDIVAQAGWLDADGEIRTPEGTGCIVDFEREDVAPGIAHYSYTVKVGEGDHDVVGLHRVVKESKPNKPIKTCKNVFLHHGDGVGFTGAFLYGTVAPSVPGDHAFAIYLAQNEIDVWGIDQNWVMVPQGTTDFSSMVDWGMQNQVENLDAVMSVARWTRQITGGGPGKMLLLGYSSGAATGYSYVNWETQKDVKNRNVRGFIPVDMAFKTDDPGLQAAAAGFAGAKQIAYEGGQYLDPVYFAPLGYLAMTDPDGASPVVPGFTNEVVALVYGAASFMLAPLTPTYHFLAGTFDSATGMPDGFQFNTTQGWYEFMLTACAYEATLYEVDVFTTMAGAVDVPFDDYLGDVCIPVLSVGSAGGLGYYNEYTLSLLGSTDVTSFNVALYPPEYGVADFGHIDLFTANNAEGLVWMPVLDWIVDHSCRQGKADQSWKKD
jgi:hypothetical protein